MAHSVQKYQVRSGTVDSGSKYENKMLTLLSLRCVLHEEDSWIASNPDEVGLFDDIVIHQGRKTYMLQLKHREVPKSLFEREFLVAKGDFSLKKYFSDITMLKESIDSKLKKPEIIDYLGSFSDIYFILFTNRDVQAYEFLKKSPETLSLLDTSVSTTTDLYKIDITKLPNSDSTAYSSNIYLLFNQVHAKNIDLQITKEIQTLATHFRIELSDVKYITERFIKYITDWKEGSLGGHYILTKRDVICKLTELLLGQYEVNLNYEKYAFYTSERKRIWNNLIRDKTLTVVDFDENVLNFLSEYIGDEVRKYCNEFHNSWTESFSAQAQTLFYQEHNHLKTDMLKIVGNYRHFTLMDVYKCLWINNQLPLLLEIPNNQHYLEVLQILKLSSYSYKVVIINKSAGPLASFNHVNGVERFDSLKDLTKDDRSKILEQTVTLQKRSSVVFGTIVEEDMFHNIKCNDIINILLGNFHIGDCLNCLPEYFVKRNLSKVFIRKEVLNEVIDEIFLIHETCEKQFNMLKVTSSNIHKLDDFNIHELQKGGIIIIPNQNVNYQEIEKNLKTSLSKPIHRLIIQDVNHLEWLNSCGTTNNIKSYRVKLALERNNLIKEQLFSSNTNLISAAPGMGKSIFVDYLALQVPIHKWVVKVELSEHFKYYRSNFCKSPTTTASQHLEYFKNASFNKHKYNSKLANAIFKKLTNTKDVIVLLDGFDEVFISYKEEVTNILTCFSKEGFNIWITTHPSLTLYLEKELNTFSRFLEPFSEKDQKEFLTKYFRTKNADLSSNFDTLIIQFVDKLLLAVKKNLNYLGAEFAGIPFEFLANVFNDDCAKFLTSNGTNEFKENLLHSYKDFFGKKPKRLHVKRGSDTDHAYIVFEEHQSLFALKRLFPLQNDLQAYFKTQLGDYYDNKPETIQSLQREGIITIEENVNEHEKLVFDEELAAQWLSENLNSSKTKEIAQALIKERFSGKYRTLFTLFDRLLAKNCPLLLAVINRQMDEAEKIIKSDIESVTAVDGGGRSLLHIVSLYGVQYPLLFQNEQDRDSITDKPDSFVSSKSFKSDEMLKFFGNIPDDKLTVLLNKTDVMGFTPLDYSLLNRSLAIAEKMSRKLKNSTISFCLSLQLKKDYLVYCALLKYNSLFNKLLPYFASKDLLLKHADKEQTLKEYFRSMFNYSNYYHKEDILAYDFQFQEQTLLQLLQSECGAVYSGWDGKCYSDIHYAVCFDSQENIKYLLKDIKKINSQDFNFNTPLHYAVLHQKPKTVELLLSKGAQINQQNNNKDTPLHLAIASDVLVSKTTKNKLQTVLASFNKSPNDVIVKKLISKCKENCLNIQNIDGNTPLHLALAKKKIIWAKICISKGANSNIQNKEGKTALHLLAQNGWNNILEKISFTDDDLNKQDNYGRTPLFYAVHNNKADTVNLLISNKARVDLKYKNGQSAVHVAAANGNIDILSKIISEGVDINEQDDAGWTPFFHAVSNNRIGAVNLLIDRKANANIENKNRETILHFAAQGNYYDILEKILPISTDINKQDCYGWTSLFYAVRNNNTNTVKLFLYNNANVNVVNEEGETVFHFAKKNKFEEIVELLSDCISINSLK